MLRFWLFALIRLLTACSRTQPTGKRVRLAKGNISFILPDSSLVLSKLILYPADYQMGSYGEAGGFYHNLDSSVIVSVYVNAYPSPAQRTVPWRVLADEKRRREEISAKNRNLAVIERFAADSSARTVTIDYHVPGWVEEGRRGQASYEKAFTFYGPQRTINFWFFAPDNAANRQAIAAAGASVRVDSTYLQASVKPYPTREYQN